MGVQGVNIHNCTGLAFRRLIYTTVQLYRLGAQWVNIHNYRLGAQGFNIHKCTGLAFRGLMYTTVQAGVQRVNIHKCTGWRSEG